MSAKVLVVDDDPQVRKVHAMFLERAGLEVVVAANGRLALEAVGLHRPAVIVTDMDMPELDGLGLCRELQAVDDTRDIPIVMVAGCDVDRAQEVRQVGCREFIQKPCAMAVLVATVQRLLTRGTSEPLEPA